MRAIADGLVVLAVGSDLLFALLADRFGLLAVVAAVGAVAAVPGVGVLVFLRLVGQVGWVPGFSGGRGSGAGLSSACGMSQRTCIGSCNLGMGMPTGTLWG